MNLFQLSEVILNSGRRSNYKIECDALSRDDWDTLAHMGKEIIGVFKEVVPIPRGGNLLAEYLRPFCSSSGPTLIVDDVFTTGQSFERARKELRDKPVLDLVAFSRGKCPFWVCPIFQLNRDLISFSPITEKQYAKDPTTETEPDEFPDPDLQV